MEDREWPAFIQSEAEGWELQLIGREEPRLIKLCQGQVLHPLCKGSRGSHEGIK